MRKKTKKRLCISCLDQIVPRLFIPGIRVYPVLLAVTFFVAAFLAVSCTDDVQSSGVGAITDAVIRLTINPQTPQSASTRSVNEDKIHDLHVLVYNNSGELTGKSYSTFDELASSYTVTVNARSGDGCKIYAVANTDNSALFDGTVANTEEKLKAITTSSTAWADLNNSSSTTTYLPMCGSTTANISAGTATLDGGITVKRLVAKVTLNVGIADGSGVLITGYRVYGVPSKSYYVLRPLNTEESATDTQVTRAEDASLPANASDWTDSGFITLSDVTSFSTSFYMYENRPGVNATITAQNQKIKLKVPATPSDSAAYVIIYGKATGYSSLSWKIYLGANNTTNFNIKRNHQYTCTITLKPNDSDTRITYKKSGTVWAGSNIYWDGAKLTFDTETSDANNKKQGVAFQWGSLIGVSLSNSYVTYTPIYTSGNPTGSSWNTGATSYSSITCISVEGSDYGQTNTFLNDATQNTDFNYVACRGDICQYLSKTQPSLGSWRMPTASEFDSTSFGNATLTNPGPWTWWGTDWPNSSQTLFANDGQTAILTGVTITVDGATTGYPASGYRDTTGTLHNVILRGYCWSSSALSGTTGSNLSFGSSNVFPSYMNLRQFGFAVRCVQN